MRIRRERRLAGLVALVVTAMTVSACAGSPAEAEKPAPITASTTTLDTAITTIGSTSSVTSSRPTEQSTDEANQGAADDHPDDATHSGDSDTTVDGNSLLSVTGVVIDVVGDLTTTTSFRLLAEEGSRLDFTVDPDSTFHGGPMSHIRDHLLSGAPVHVEYVVRADSLIATYAEDADHDH